uniref:Uncharacterized protein n=1 Tax=viral metagenome TaxID=1070528 RepID=A0A6C0I525_9ZZZZ
MLDPIRIVPLIEASCKMTKFCFPYTFPPRDKSDPMNTWLLNDASPPVTMMPSLAFSVPILKLPLLIYITI